MTGNELGTTHIMEDDLDQALEAIARVPILLVATDYDGTLSPIVDNPEDAKDPYYRYFHTHMNGRQLPYVRRT